MKNNKEKTQQYKIGYLMGLCIGVCIMLLSTMLIVVILTSKPSTSTFSRGFGKIKVLNPSISYSGTTLRFRIFNGVGKTITGTNITVEGCTCASSICQNIKIGAGDFYQINVTCPFKDRGESFSVFVNITYFENVGGTLVLHQDKGILMGSAD
ncbi:MAG: hypothetical protein QW802_04870 [Candidatus Altiarchaeota archaeon]